VGRWITSITVYFPFVSEVRKIYDELNKKFDFIAVIGDLDDTPNSAPLRALLGSNSNLLDIMKHEKFVGDDSPGTHGNVTKSGKLDYILMSPELAEKAKLGGIERRGVWEVITEIFLPIFLR
jgi:endonuclease/exonuclease/phosphatase family metal-dependent hydrolase